MSATTALDVSSRTTPMAEEGKRWRKKKREPEKGDAKDAPRDEKSKDPEPGEKRRKKLYG